MAYAGRGILKSQIIFTLQFLKLDLFRRLINDCWSIYLFYKYFNAFIIIVVKNYFSMENKFLE
ncbi:hypothetical protein B6S66_10270 [Citrobacter werkmanii]|nr:hypothetical protein BO998_03705 [Citrobacter werkmanii]OSP18088.1 hypothetical protein B6S66_10270 [Citrobacter werkmanii]